MSYFTNDGSQMDCSEARTLFQKDTKTVLSMLSAHFRQSNKRSFSTLTKDLTLHADKWEITLEHRKKEIENVLKLLYSSFQYRECHSASSAQ